MRNATTFLAISLRYQRKIVSSVTIPTELLAQNPILLL
jgi:hypothetical protein